jgi:hypothetical protein
VTLIVGDEVVELVEGSILVVVTAIGLFGEVVGIHSSLFNLLTHLV